MLWRYAHLIPQMVTDCLAPQGVQGETWELVLEPAGWAFRKNLSDEHVDQFRRAHELRQAIVDQAKRERTSPGEARRAHGPSSTDRRAPPPYVLLDLLECSPEHQKGLDALARILDALARIPGLEIQGQREHLVWDLALAIGESAARRPPETPEPGAVHAQPPRSPTGFRVSAATPVSDDECDLDEAATGLPAGQQRRAPAQGHREKGGRGRGP